MQKIDLFKLDGHTLKVFLTVFETGSISRASDVFDLNQSTISHTIDRMRAAVGDPLFVKAGRGITPTEKSISIAPQVQEILAGLEGLIAVEDYDPWHDTSTMSIGVPTPALIPEMKATYDIIRAKAPQTQFNVIRLAPRERMAEMLTSAEIDVAIAINSGNLPANLNAARYGQDKLVVYFDPNMRGPITNLDDYLSAQHGVAGHGGNSKSIVDMAFGEAGLQRKVCVSSPTASTLGQFIVGTDMIATMPLGLAKETYNNLDYCMPPLALPDLIYDLVWHRRFEHSGRNRWIRNTLLESAFRHTPDI